MEEHAHVVSIVLFFSVIDVVLVLSFDCFRRHGTHKFGSCLVRYQKEGV